MVFHSGVYVLRPKILERQASKNLVYSSRYRYSKTYKIFNDMGLLGHLLWYLNITFALFFTYNLPPCQLAIKQ